MYPLNKEPVIKKKLLCSTRRPHKGKSCNPNALLGPTSGRRTRCGPQAPHSCYNHRSCPCLAHLLLEPSFGERMPLRTAEIGLRHGRVIHCGIHSALPPPLPCPDLPPSAARCFPRSHALRAPLRVHVPELLPPHPHRIHHTASSVFGLSNT